MSLMRLHPVEPKGEEVMQLGVDATFLSIHAVIPSLQDLLTSASVKWLLAAMPLGTTFTLMRCMELQFSY